MGDFTELKNQLPASWMVATNGKIYWCAESAYHKFDIVDGKLLVDGFSANDAVRKLLEEG